MMLFITVPLQFLSVLHFRWFSQVSPPRLSGDGFDPEKLLPPGVVIVATWGGMGRLAARHSCCLYIWVVQLWSVVGGFTHCKWGLPSVCLLLFIRTSPSCRVSWGCLLPVVRSVPVAGPVGLALAGSAYLFPDSV